MLEDLLSKNEGKTLEFKENLQSINKIIKTIIAFANTSGGKIVVGIKDKTKDVVGVDNVLLQEERIANSIAECIEPLICPDIEIQTYRNKEIIIIHVYHNVGPYYLKSAGEDKGVYIRLGSTNRIADKNIIYNLKLIGQNLSYDELPYPVETSEIDWKIAKKLFKEVNKTLTEQKGELLKILTRRSGKLQPTIGGLILFGLNKETLFPDATIRCARFLGLNKLNFLDQRDITDYLPLALDAALSFVERNTRQGYEIKDIRRKDIPEYPRIALREAISNALVHADYSIKGTTITVAIFDDRIEIENPGSLTYGLTLEQALSGSSKLRNPVIAGVFRELKLIERWGTGIKRIQESCYEHGLKAPEFQEINNNFRVTLYSIKEHKAKIQPWQKKLVKHLEVNKKVSNKEAAKLWNINPRTARDKLKNMIDLGIIRKIATSSKDPYAFFVLS